MFRAWSMFPESVPRFRNEDMRKIRNLQRVASILFHATRCRPTIAATQPAIVRNILMKRLISLLAAGALGLLAALPAQAASLAKIKEAGTFRIGTEGTYAPFTYHDSSNQLVGFDVEIGRAIAKRLGVKAEFLEGKWDGLIAGLDGDRYDAVINQVGITEARKKKYDFSDSYIASKAVLIVRGDNSEIKGFADLKGKKSAQTLTSNFGKLAEQNGAELVGTDGFDQSIQLVLNGRADATINDSLSFLDFKKHKPDANVKIVAQEANADHSGVIIAKGEPKLLAAINKALADIKADGTYKKIADKYFGQDVSE
jgi:cystine transport system substrate-binding protein